MIVGAGSRLGQRSTEPVISHSVPGKRSFDVPSPAESPCPSRLLQDVQTVFCALSLGESHEGAGLRACWPCQQCNAICTCFAPPPLCSCHRLKLCHNANVLFLCIYFSQTFTVSWSFFFSFLLCHFFYFLSFSPLPPSVTEHHRALCLLVPWSPHQGSETRRSEIHGAR